MSILVTTGATVTFEHLLQHVASARFLSFISKYTDTLIIQYGPLNDSLQFISKCIDSVPPTFTRVSVPDSKSDSTNAEIVLVSSDLELRLIPFHPQLPDLIKQCKLVISHAGTGSIVDVLRCKVPLIIVTNSKLMNNHQMEASDEFSVRHRYCLSCQDTQLPTGKLEQLISDKQWQSLEILAPPNGGVIEHILYGEILQRLPAT